MKTPLLFTSNAGKAVTASEGTTTVSSAVFNLSTTIIGCGIMSIPATLEILGICPAFFLIAFIAFLCNISAQSMLRYTLYGNSAAYVELMTESFGKVGFALLQMCIVLNNFGGLVIYLMIIGDVVSGNGSERKSAGILVEWFGQGRWNSRVVALLLTLVVVLQPLALLKQIDSLFGSKVLYSK